MQEKEVVAVGSTETRIIDTRILCATNRDLAAEVHKGRFRADLYYRLQAIQVEVPPLRDRVEDLPVLVRRFLQKFNDQFERGIEDLSNAAWQAVRTYSWPGNVRELQNAVERALITWRGGPLRIDLARAGPHARAAAPGAAEPAVLLTERELRELERDNLQRAMVQARWKVSGPGGAAERLGVKPTTLASRLRKLRITRPAE